MNGTRKVKCPCGLTVSKNTLGKHIDGPNCGLAGEPKVLAQKVVRLRTEKGWGWKKSEGPNARRRPDWFIDVLHGGSSLQDWVFESPRARGRCTPEFYKRESFLRKGQGNPDSRSKPKYPLEDLKLAAQQAFEEIAKDPKRSFKEILGLLEGRFPYYGYSSPVHGLSKQDFVALLLDKTREDWRAIRISRRGDLISAGQRSSPAFMAMAKNAGANLLSKFRVTRPQRLLAEVLTQVDSGTRMEKRLGGYSFDIFMPGLNCLVEMHGEVWHRHTKDFSLPDLVDRNIKNDIAKSALAAECGFQLEVFWDCDMDRWPQQVEERFGVKIHGFQEAKDRIYQKPRRSARLRHGD